METYMRTLCCWQFWAKSMAENMMLKRVGPSTQPCLTSFVSWKVPDDSPSSSALASIPWWKERTSAVNLFGHPNFFMIFQRPSWQTDKGREIDKGRVKGTVLFLAFFLEVVWLQKSYQQYHAQLWRHWLSGKSPCSRWCKSLLSSTRARSLPAIVWGDMPRWLSQQWWLPFFLYRWTMVPSLNYWGTDSFSNISL